jgi:hypothetical protein
LYCDGKCTNFPPPTNLAAAVPGNAVLLNWVAPVNANPSYYKVYRAGGFDVVYLPIDSTTNTYDLIYPDFLHSEWFTVTAVYHNPDGESTHEGPAMITTGPISLPYFEDFEFIPAIMGHLTLSGANSWIITNSTSVSGQNCALMPPSSPGDICHLYNSFWKENTISTIRISFWAMIPSSLRGSDTLNLIYNQDNLLATLYSIEDWTYYEFHFIDSSLSGFNISYEGISSGGGGIYLDNVNIEEQSINIEENAFKTDLLIYPNPAKELLFISLPPENTSNSRIEIYDPAGRCVKVYNTLCNQRIVKMDLTHLQKGYYIVKISNNRRVYCKKLIINS